LSPRAAALGGKRTLTCGAGRGGRVQVVGAPAKIEPAISAVAAILG
jgi:hypothetical protein